MPNAVIVRATASCTIQWSPHQVGRGIPISAACAHQQFCSRARCPVLLAMSDHVHDDDSSRGLCRFASSSWVNRMCSVSTLTHMRRRRYPSMGHRRSDRPSSYTTRRRMVVRRVDWDTRWAWSSHPPRDSFQRLVRRARYSAIAVRIG